MDIIALLTSFIYLISSSMLLPVLLLLSLSTVWVFVYAGSFCTSWLRRKRLTLPDDRLGALAAGSYDRFPERVRSFVTDLERGRKNDPSRLFVLDRLRATERELWGSLDRLKIMVRIGPGLGLIGTLIPMGTGLAGLSQGDFNRLSGDLVIAFTTTVVGMALGLVCYVFFTVQRRWVEEDLQHIELAAEILARDAENPQGREEATGGSHA